MMELAKVLKRDGVDKGLCRLWRGKLKAGMSIEAMIQLYIRGIDFCICEDYPTLNFIRENFKGKCEPYGAFVDDDITDRRNAPDIVLNGDCKAMLEYDGYSVSRIFARHNTKAAINVSDHAILTIDAFNQSDLIVAVSGSDAQVSVNLYGDSSVQCIGDGIKVNKKNKVSY
ncbi:hypothetical protein [Dysgonomonas mossii]|uniref:hypothetical protein n=1 Tax=Dysgonomonas mossii TaxID=163665 RepID=UPI003992CAAC